MRKILQRLAWKTHEWDVKINFLTVYLGGNNGKFGIEIIGVDNGIFWKGSLFEFTWSFPTVTHGGLLSIDMLFSFNKWNMSDTILWGGSVSRWGKLNIYLNDWFTSIR